MKWIVRFVENHLWFVEHTHALEGKRGNRNLIAYLRWMYHAMRVDRKELSLRKPNRHYMWQSVKGTTRIDIEDVPRNTNSDNDSPSSN
jgi:hypothetical protein